MRNHILFFGLLTVLIGCAPKSNNIDFEIKLLNDIFLELIGTEYYYQELPDLPMPLEYAENKQDSLNYKVKKEEFDEAFDNPKLDKSNLVLGINPYSINPKRQFKDWNTNEPSFPRMHYKESLHSKDFDSLLSQLIDSTKFEKRKLELDKITNSGLYTITDLGELEQQNKEYWKSNEFRYIASIRFSDFKINSTSDKAIFYFDFLCGSLCGSTEIIFCEKENNEWKIIDRIMLSVS